MLLIAANKEVIKWLACWALMGSWVAVVAQPCLPEDTRYRVAAFGAVNRFEELPYAEAVLDRTEPTALCFDFFEPTNDTIRQRPLLLFVADHRALGFSRDLPDYLVAWCDSFALRGYVCAVVRTRSFYTTTSPPSAILPNVADVRHAVQYFATHYNTFGIDTNRIYLGGDGNGATVALLAAASAAGDGATVQLAGVLNLRGAIPLAHLQQLTADTSNFQTPLFSVGDERRALPAGEWYTPDQTAPTNATHQFFKGTPPNYMTTEGNPFLSDSTRQRVGAFLYQSLSLRTPTPKGNTRVCPQRIYTYSIPENPAFDYCWETAGGFVLEENHHTAQVVWEENGGENWVRVTALGNNQCKGEPSAPFRVALEPEPVAAFAIEKASANVVIIHDQSCHASHYTLLFGDGGVPYSGVAQSATNHVYLQTTAYIVGQLVTNSCGMDWHAEVIGIESLTAIPPDGVLVHPNSSAKVGERVYVNVLQNTYHLPVRVSVTHEGGSKVFDQTRLKALHPSFVFVPMQAGNHHIRIEKDGTSVEQSLEVRPALAEK